MTLSDGNFDQQALNEMNIEVSKILKSGQTVRMSPTHMIVSPVGYRAILWETDGAKRWIGRDRRRLKRERRKWMTERSNG